MRVSSMRNSFFVVVVVVAVLWMITYYLAPAGPSRSSKSREVREREKLQEKLKKLSTLVAENNAMVDKLKADIVDRKNKLLKKIRSEISAKPRSTELAKVVEQEPKKEVVQDEQIPAQIPKITNNDITIPVVITACNRPSVSRCLDKLFTVRGDKIKQFPVIVSQDCGDKATADVLNEYGNKITFIKHNPEPVLAGVQSNLIGYYKISSHYKFAITQAFQHFPEADSIIILEDDIEVAPDFLTYFSAMHELLKKDDTLWCASAWNDNGKTNIVDGTEQGAELLYRSDFFPGLGWMLKRSLWEGELASKWPQAFWDDWMRQASQRKGRACIRPEVSRTSTFGRKGVSGGQFFDSHLKYIKLNEFPVDWSSKDLSYLMKDNYDKNFKSKVYGAPSFRMSDLKDNKDPDVRELRIEYSMAATFKAFAKDLGLMLDFKDGVPRTAYMGVVTTLYRGRRVYLAPPEDWQGYNEKWT